MGHHYVPQEYLRGFSDPNDPCTIWMYDKQSGRFAHPSIKKVVQEAGYYTEEIERQLSEIVEKPANKVLDRLRRGERIGDNERSHLALYIGTMLMRVPRRRRKAFEMLPAILEDTISKVTAQVTRWSETTTADPGLVSRRFAEIKRAREKFIKDPPLEIVEQIRAPWPSSEVLSLVSATTWRVISPSSAVCFLTSDNPAHFFEAYGLGSPESELTFPLVSDLALVASWQGPPGETIFVRARPTIAKEINRRVASGAERFVFYHARQDWIAKISNKQHPYLSRIQW
jgi:hypothetical protein